MNDWNVHSALRLNATATVPLIDAHIHVDSYPPEQQELLLASLVDNHVEAIVAVSMHLASSQANLRLAERWPRLVRPAFGLHPEQALPSQAELDLLFHWMDEHVQQMVAVGEVGLPYYNRLEASRSGDAFDIAPYIVLLERFIQFASKHSKPIVLHAVYEDADMACDLLERHGVTQAHFHWFKGSAATTERMARNGYYVSFTPDLLYEEEIRSLARQYPSNQVMAETDGPWPFEGPFTGQQTHPRMTAEVIREYSKLTGQDEATVRQLFYDNTSRFYSLSNS
ncbi:TatD family hydrolase [Paenibacillus polymyxa]|uniref:TatD family hydrolase n=1 Tax=Paenibacillus polymyxa TaxID=1406 RepID=UPI0025B730FB|nr:TatD family hydrolase [Paenibacillus polymyxa]MDN4080944.1 TatD family hydrolase [Paenibacillus polymyxa]MDN4106571.1 TatD family hydrolase [Paenibacillus polymyxa]MDN4116584.1 TatD family hydrolase [Paenibacillus polymyxa]